MATAKDIQYHYDVDTSFFELFLDSRHRAYSCAVWDSADNLEDAQTNKLKRIASFANILPGSCVLDIGCGWGGELEFVTRIAGAQEAVGITLSQDQYDYLSYLNNPAIHVELCSWRDYEPQKRFDAVISIGAFEHFASREERIAGSQITIYRDFFKKCAELTTDESFMGLQTIVTKRIPRNSQETRDTLYLLRHVFPGSVLPKISDIHEAAANIYEVREFHTIGRDYAKTLTVWKERLISAESYIRNKYGCELFEHHLNYFNAAKRSFENDLVDLAQFSLQKTCN